MDISKSAEFDHSLFVSTFQLLIRSSYLARFWLKLVRIFKCLLVVIQEEPFKLVRASIGIFKFEIIHGKIDDRHLATFFKLEQFKVC